MSPKVKSRQELEKELDLIFSRYIRLKHSDYRGFCRCITCGVTKPWTQLQAGHFIRRGHHSLRWSEVNVHPQCVECNEHKRGNEKVYAEVLVQMYGKDAVNGLKRLKNDTCKLSRSELIELIKEYKAKIKKLE